MKAEIQAPLVPPFSALLFSLSTSQGACREAKKSIGGENFFTQSQCPKLRLLDQLEVYEKPVEFSSHVLENCNLK